MICYQDERMLGAGDLTPEELQAKIDEYEISRFGHKLPEDFGRDLVHKQMIYDVKQRKLVEYDSAKKK